MLLGATGFTGRLVAARLAEVAPPTLRWALAGRRPAALDAMAQELGGEVGTLVVDVTVEEDLERLARSTRLVVNLVGPFLHRGVAVVGACARTGTDYCDLAGELPFIRRSIDAWHEAAVASGARVVHACGYDCVPSEAGLWAVRETLKERGLPLPASVTGYIVELKAAMSGGSAASLLDQGALPADERARAEAPRGLGSGGAVPGEEEPAGPSWDAARGAWTTPFFPTIINTRVVRRGIALSDWPDGFAYREAFVGGRGLPGRLKAHGAWLVLRLLSGLTRRAWGRALLRALLPSPGRGPSPKAIAAGGFRHEIVPTLPDGSRPLTVVVACDEDPGYGATRRMLTACALAMVADGFAAPAGVITPGVAFGPALGPMLRRAGLTVEVTEGG